MPRLPIDFSKTVIYKLCCNDVNIKEIYVGHTTDLIRRKQEHKHHCVNEKSNAHNQYKYQFIRNNGGWDNWKAIPIEEYPCNNVNQARIRERYWIEELKALLNKELPSRTKEEYKKKWYPNNKDKVINYSKDWFKNNKDKKKEYNEKYKDKRIEQQKERRQNKRIYDFVIFMNSF